MDRNNISEEDIFISLFVGRWLRKAPYNLDISKKQISFYIYHLTDFAATVIVRNHLEQ